MRRLTPKWTRSASRTDDCGWPGGSAGSGGARRRGLADLDPVTGRALSWNPDAPGGAYLDVGSDGTWFVQPGAAISGRSRGRLASFSTATGAWLPWRPALGDFTLFAEGSAAPQRRPAFRRHCAGDRQPRCDRCAWACDQLHDDGAGREVLRTRDRLELVWRQPVQQRGRSGRAVETLGGREDLSRW